MSGSTVVYLMVACLAVGALGGWLAGDLHATSRWERADPVGQHAPDVAPGTPTQRGGPWPEPLSPRLTDRFVHAPTDDLPRQYGTRAEHQRREEIRLRPAEPPARVTIDAPLSSSSKPLALVAAVALSAVDSVEVRLGVGRYRRSTYPWTRPDPELERLTWLADTGQLPGLMEDRWTSQTSRAA